MNIQPHPGRQPQQQQQQQQVHIQLPQTPISTTAKSPPLSPKSAEKKASNPDKVNSIDAELEKTEDDDNNEDYHKIHILIAVTGSVATIKIPLIISKLRQIYGKYAVVQLIVTSSAQHFLNTVKLPQGLKFGMTVMNGRRDEVQALKFHNNSTYNYDDGQISYWLPHYQPTR